MLYGLLAALGWGVADLSAAFSGRRIGSTRTAAVAQVVSLVTLLALGFLLGEGFHASGQAIAVLLANGVLAAAAYVTLYRSLELGPVALVSPIVAAYAAISVLLAVVVKGESLRPLLVGGVVLTMAGVFLASADPRELRRGGRLLRAGVPWAIASMLLFGVATYVLGYWSQRVGWYASSLLSRVGNVAGVLLFALWAIGREGSRTRLSLKTSRTALLVGVADIFGVVAFARGTQLGLISVVSAISASFILIPVFGGLVMFREKPAASQLVGVGAVFLGLVFLGLGA